MTARTTEEIEALLTAAPSEGEDRLPCAVCGISTPAEEGPIEYRDTTRYSPAGNVVGGQTWVEMTLCSACQQGAERAAGLVHGHQGLVRALGPGGAERASGAVVAALDLLGMDPPPLSITDKDLGVLVRRFGHVGALLAYRRVATAWVLGAVYLGATLAPFVLPVWRGHPRLRLGACRRASWDRG